MTFSSLIAMTSKVRISSLRVLLLSRMFLNWHMSVIKYRLYAITNPSKYHIDMNMVKQSISANNVISAIAKQPISANTVSSAIAKQPISANQIRSQSLS